MKKTYELVQVNVISLGNDDIIRTSYAEKKTGDDNTLLGGNFDLGGMNVQDFS